MSSEILKDKETASQQNEDTPFSVKLIQVVASTEGMISRIFSDIEPVLVLTPH
jgi:hypothetical protein